MVVVDDDEGEVALEPRVDGAHGRDEIAVVDVLEQVRDDFGVGLRRKGVTGGGELVAQLAVVLDDAVQDDRERLVVAGRQRMRVLLGDAAVRRPAGVAERRSSTREPFGSAASFRNCRFPTARTYSRPSSSRSAMPGGVVAAELEALEPREQAAASRRGYRRIR